MLLRLRPALVRGFSLVSLLLAMAGLAWLPSGCRPEPGAGDPVQLIWDEDALDGLTGLLKLSRVEGIRVFFWNIGWSSLNDGNIIEKNLSELINSNARPDLIILAEFKEDAIPTKDLDFLKQEFPYYSIESYQPGSEVGMAVFGSVPFTMKKPEVLDWAPLGVSEESKAKYRGYWESRAPDETKHWDRPYLHYQWKIAGHVLNLVPLHLLEPWKAYGDVHGQSAILWNAYTNGENPLKNQISRLRQKLKRDFGPRLDQEALLMVGDFNIPKRTFQVPMYQQLSMFLEEVFTGNPDTYPSASAPAYKIAPYTYDRVKIDHGFVNKHFEVVGAHVTPLRGSDHYPIYFVIKPRS